MRLCWSDGLLRSANSELLCINWPIPIRMQRDLVVYTALLACDSISTSISVYVSWSVSWSSLVFQYWGLYNTEIHFLTLLDDARLLGGWSLRKDCPHRSVALGKRWQSRWNFTCHFFICGFATEQSLQRQQPKSTAKIDFFSDQRTFALLTTV